MPRPYSRIAVLCVLAACTTRTIRPREVTASAAAAPTKCRRWCSSALTLDAAGDRHADTLYTSDAVVWATPAYSGALGSRDHDRRRPSHNLAAKRDG